MSKGGLTHNAKVPFEGQESVRVADPASFQPKFRTPDEEICKEELNKLNSNGMRGSLHAELRDGKPDLSWESEQLAKSYGVYLEYNRAQTGKEKDWFYMVRVAVPGGGPLSREQWLALDDLSERYTRGPSTGPSLRLTTRQNIQLHWVRKEQVLEIVRTLAGSGLFTLNGCGDNVRNTMACPLSRHSDVFDGVQWARETAAYFRLPVEPFIEIFAVDPSYVREEGETFQYGSKLLNRKFKIACSSICPDPVTGEPVPDNCVELRTNDLAVAPILEDGKVAAFQLYLGGGQGQRNGKPTVAALGEAFAVVSASSLMKTMDAVVQVHQEWGDRQNRHWARVKYVVRKMGIPWYRQQVEERLGSKLGEPDPAHDYGARMLHHGWHVQPTNGLLTLGVFIENGRITDESANGRLKTMVRDLVRKYPVSLQTTPNQDLLFTDIPPDAKDTLEADLASYGYGRRNGAPYSRLRILSGACVGRDTCKLTYTDSERFEPMLVDELERMGWGDMAESIGVTGCERQCFRPATKTIGLVGSGKDRYQFKVMGTEDGRHQGVPLTSEDGMAYLHNVPGAKAALVVDALFRHYRENREEGESLGLFHRRVGLPEIIRRLSQDPATAELMKGPRKETTLLGAP
jgi:sulfite reductase beta subunit-like hemoprotein